VSETCGEKNGKSLAIFQNTGQGGFSLFLPVWYNEYEKRDADGQSGAVGG